MGVKNLAFKVGVRYKELEDSIEPTLLLDGYVDRTGRGRVITDKGRRTVARILH